MTTDAAGMPAPPRMHGEPDHATGGKKINGRKRHLAVDVEGLLLAVVVTADR
jgi:hypothetical protein